jgi:hypothetical protein
MSKMVKRSIGNSSYLPYTEFEDIDIESIYRSVIKECDRELKEYDQSVNNIKEGGHRQWQRQILLEMLYVCQERTIQKAVDIRERAKKMTKIYKRIRKGKVQRLLPVEEAKLIPLENLVDLEGVRHHRNKIQAKCPFEDHNDKTASFFVYEENNSYHCFGCQRGGDTINFIMNMYNIDFVEAVKYITEDEKTIRSSRK